MVVMPNTVNSKQLTVNRQDKTVHRLLSTVYREGFTLVELLVVLGLLSITVGSTLLFLTSTLKGSNSAAITAEVKQNGQSVLDSLERQIRGATNAARVVPADPTQIVLTKQDNTSLYIKCTPAVANVSNGWIGTSAISTGPFTPLTNKDDIVSGISVDNCLFNVTASSGGGSSPPVVSMEFTMSQGISAPSRADFVANAKFQTTISLRQAVN
jgi:prepilin-type N-terminal cleavage/methylation domain-containing protein